MITSVIGSNNDFRRLNPTESIQYGLSKFFKTKKGTYPFDPEYGLSIYDNVFDQIDSNFIRNIQLDIQNDIATYFPNVIVRKVDINQEGRNIYISIAVQINNKYYKFNKINVNSL